MNDNFIVFLLMSLGYGYFDSIPHFRYYAYHYVMQKYIYIGISNHVILKRENIDIGKIIGKIVHKIPVILYHHEYEAGGHSNPNHVHSTRVTLILIKFPSSS